MSQPNPTPELESLAALLRLVTAKGLADSTGLLARKEAWAEGLLSKASTEELDRLVEIAMTVLSEEAKGR